MDETIGSPSCPPSKKRTTWFLVWERQSKLEGLEARNYLFIKVVGARVEYDVIIGFTPRVSKVDEGIPKVEGCRINWIVVIPAKAD